jgi:hypothetical protein
MIYPNLHQKYKEMADSQLSEDCPQITEEEFEKLQRLGFAMAEAKTSYNSYHDELLSKYGRKRIESVWEDGLPRKMSSIYGRYIKTLDCIS